MCLLSPSQREKKEEKVERNTNNNTAAQLHTKNKMGDTTLVEDHECYDDYKGE